ncbi:MAG TPA: hypothetical protein VGG02_05080 [Chthoniobacterales bacterium]|jgi:hypothetical protein
MPILLDFGGEKGLYFLQMKMRDVLLLAGLAWVGAAFVPAGAQGAVPTEYPDQVIATTTNGTLKWDLYIPAPPVAPPYNVVLVIHVGEFKTGSRKDVDYVAYDLAAAGFAAAAIDYRSDDVRLSEVDGQRRPVFAPPAKKNQVEDVQTMILAARFPNQAPLFLNGKSQVTGWVAAVGGSAGAAHALWCAATGTLSDTRLNAAALLSGPYLFDDPRSLTDNASLGCKDKKSGFAGSVTTYCKTSNGDRNYTTKLEDGSALEVMDNTVSPLIAFGTVNDPITPYQYSDVGAQLSKLGLLSDTADYSITQLSGSAHAFEYWDEPNCGNTPGVATQVENFLLAHVPGS